ncbi:MAG TPA: TSUP family transporter, partial [Stellaceae bacterium]|nr:TSUP family transporter [Stellaceae bacterium]
NYALSGLVDWRIALELIAGGAAGGWLGMRLAVRMAAERRTLTYVFAAVVFAVAAYMLVRTSLALGA